MELEGAKVEEWRVWGSRACRVEGGRVESVGVESVQGGRWRSGECGGRRFER